MSENLTLYQRDDCHLCDLALDVLAAARVPEFDSVFIDGDDDLEHRYGVRVPVLRDGRRGVELDWPFDVGTLQEWLGPVNAIGTGHAATECARDKEEGGSACRYTPE